MAEPSISQFFRTLAVSRLLTDAQLAMLKKQLVGSSLTAAGLARVLVRQTHLTEWQAAQLLKGQSGFVLQQYQLLYPIGRGGMGQVFCARNTQATDTDSRHVAVKVMAKKLTGNETLVSRFRREIRASSKLNSPHIVRTLDAGRVGSVDFMVMEYVNGEQVDSIAKHCERLPAGVACDMIRQAALGLQHAHEHQMVHRDLKPGNMMVHWDDSGAGTVKLMDMGLVLVLSDDGSEQTVTRAGQVMGTPEYMSPEQGWDTAKVDIRSDIYSLGCTLFRLLTGQLPFTGTNPLQVLSQRLQRDAPSVNTVCADIPDDVAAVVCHMTRRDPDARYQTPAEVAAALQPLSQPLTKQALQACAVVTEPEAAATTSGGDGSGEDSDGTFHQFLKEMQEHSDVELMLATDPSESSDVSTIPVFELPAPSPRPSAGRSAALRSAGRTRSQHGQRVALVAGGIGLAVLGASLWLMRDTSVPAGSTPAVAVSSTADDRLAEVSAASPATGSNASVAAETEFPDVTEFTDPVTSMLPVSEDTPGAIEDVNFAERSTGSSSIGLSPTGSGSSSRPTELQQVLADLPVQQVTAGTMFRFVLPAMPQRPELATLRRVIEAGPDAPAGLTVSPQTQEVVWEIPEDTSGTVSFRLTGRLEDASTQYPLEGTMLMQLNVAPAAESKPTNSLPPAADIDAAIAELRETYSRTIAAARTSADKVILANRLLQQSYDADAGVADAAVLQMVDELAARAKATDVLFESARLRSERYGTSELAAASRTIQSFRKGGLDALQKDLVIEHGLRLSEQAVAAADFALTVSLLQMVKTLMSRNATGASAALTADVTSAEKIASELAQPSGAATDHLRAAELSRLVGRWQFRPFLGESTSLAYVQASTAAVTADNGRSLWDIQPDTIRLQSETLPAIMGILDRTQTVDRYVLRFQLGAGCNCAQLVFGANGGTSSEFDAYRIVLNSSALGSIQAFRDNTALNTGVLPSAAQNFFDDANLIEVAVDGPAVAVRINGISVAQAQIPALMKGMLGIAADLRRPAPRLLVRQPRILLLPDKL